MDNLIQQFINDEIRQSYEAKKRLLEDINLTTLIKEVAEKCVEVYKRGNKILLAGNGGSAADAQHIAAELSGRFNLDRAGIPSTALTTNTSELTAIANDYGYENVFSRLLEANGVEGDMFIGISTSGNSLNIINALKTCQKKGIVAVGFSGVSAYQMDDNCDFCLKVPAESTPRIQECHILIGHIICAIVEESLFGKFAKV